MADSTSGPDPAAFPKAVTIDGSPRLRLADWGGPPGAAPLLLLHGMAAHSHWWDGVAPALARSRRVAALDFRGHGDSGWAEPPAYAFADYAGDVERARAALGLESFDLVGHSLGARVALRYCGGSPARVRRLAAIDFLAEIPAYSGGRFAELAKTRQPLYGNPKAMVERFRLEPPATSAPRAVLEALAKNGLRECEDGWTWKFDWRALAIEFPPVWPELAGVKCPALIVRGERSTVMPREAFHRAAAALPRAEAVEIAEAHHHVPLDAPRELAKALSDFLSA